MDELHQRGSEDAIPLKGRVPARRYPVAFPEVCARHRARLYDMKEADRAVRSWGRRFPEIGIDIVTRLFPPCVLAENRPFDRLPILLGEAGPEKLEFNLRYQDTRIKLAVEDKLGHHHSDEEYHRDAEGLMEVAGIFLCMRGAQGRPLWQIMTDNDLDAVIYSVLDAYDPQRRVRFLNCGYQTNEFALQGVMELGGTLLLEELVRYQIFAGTVWWLRVGPRLHEQFPAVPVLTIDDLPLLTRDVLSGPCQLVFLFDDNGELVWDLLLIQQLLQGNPALKITGIVGTLVVDNNANQLTVERCLQDPLLMWLRGCNRFTLFGEPNPRSAIDPSYCSRALLDAIRSSEYAYVKGVSFFETIQKLPVVTYYGFVVHSQDSQICTGLDKGSGVLVRVPASEAAYRYRIRTLAQCYTVFQSQKDRNDLGERSMRSMKMLTTRAELMYHLKSIGYEKEEYQIAVEALIFNADGKLVLLLRGPKAKDERFKFEGIGGGLEEGDEDLHTRLRMEIGEEIVSVQDERVRADVVIDRLFEVRPVQFQDAETQKWIDWVVVSYLCRLKRGIPVNNETEKHIGIFCMSVPELFAWPEEIAWDETQGIIKPGLSRSLVLGREVYKQRYGDRPYYEVPESE